MENGLSYQHQTWYTYTLWHSLGRRSKGQRSRSQSQENCHGRQGRF